MCLKVSSVLPWHSWNWSGDEIVHKPIIPASRTVPGTGKPYRIDIREFLTTANNAVVSEALGGLMQKLPPEGQARFRSHSRGSFDFRVDQVVAFTSRMRYLPAHNKTGRRCDAWLFPDETLAQGGGDCEDLAFLLAALILASGVSHYCVRVAIGTLDITPARGKTSQQDHCWVMYLNESGAWEILDPAAESLRAARGPRFRGSAPSLSTTTEYVPHYVFNSDHLWLVRSRRVESKRLFHDYCSDPAFWRRFDPRFAKSVHDTIFDDALRDIAPADGISAMKRKSLWLDANIATYDPRDHFDNGYIAEGWTKVRANLDQFRRHGSDWGSFGAAGHAIADFYAHSSYVHFARLIQPASPNGQAVIYEPGVAMAAQPGYSSAPAAPDIAPFDLTSGRFSVNPRLYPGTLQDAAQHWDGELISGRYAQKYDPKAGFFEGFTSLPASLPNAPDYAWRGALPHHNEIAVDGASRERKHLLYSDKSSGPADRQCFANQFRWRKNAAIAHLRKAFLENRPA